MSQLFLGLDTSNYKTSAALYCPETQAYVNCGSFLQVPQGGLGLRQSEALFQQVRRLPRMVEQACRELRGEIVAVGYSAKPREREDSYMPCFLAGQCAAECIAAVLDRPAYGFSHQQGHLAAAAFSVGRLDLLKKPFLAWHLSGGTTELLLIQLEKDQLLAAEIIGGSRDISAGQVIDRAGVAMGLPFPAGPYVEQKALAWASEEAFPVKVEQSWFSLSGVQNQYEARIRAGETTEAVCRFVLNTVAQAVLRATRQARKTFDLPVLISGGVSACSFVRQALEAEREVWFAQKGLGGDNALGPAILAAMR